MNDLTRMATGVVAFTVCATEVFAGGSGLNVVVVANQNSSNSLQLASYYCEQRAVPPQNVLRINWAGGNVAWTRSQFETTLRAPLNAMLTSRQLTSQIDYVLLSMDIPYRVTESTGQPATSGVNGTTSALFYGFKPDGVGPNRFCNLPAGSASAYAGSEGIFRQTPPLNATSNAWLVMMLTSSNLEQARAVVDRGVASDFTFPTQIVYLAKSADRLRNIRFYHFDDAVINTRLREQPAIGRTNAETPNGLGAILGYQNGVQNFSLAPGNFVAGALADSLTSFGGYLFENSGHTDALDFLNAGATASYGTVIEPCNYFEKFPSPQNVFYQARGFGAAECYYLSVTNPYQGVLVGEPLAAPFATPATGGWSNLTAGAVLAGTTHLTLGFQAASLARPIQQVDLFVDGVFAQTLTNLPPRASDVLHVTINGFPTNYTVPASASLKSIASNLTLRLNAASYTSATKVSATAHGDRIELQSLDLNRSGDTTSLEVSNQLVTAGTFITASRTNFLDRVAYGLRSYLITNTAGSNVPVGAFLQAVVIQTNGTAVTVSVTNTASTNTLAYFAREFFTNLNQTSALQGPGGLVVEDDYMHEDPPYAEYGIYSFDDHSGEFNVRARSPGWPEAQVQIAPSGSSNFKFTVAPDYATPAGTNRLDENLTDLYPRNHLYFTSGQTNLSFTFALNTTAQSDGFHELTAVAYEGSHVRTQKRITQHVRIQNTSLAASFTCVPCETNTAVEATLQFSVVANTSAISRIELFSTGGSWGVMTNQQAATFAVTGLQLGAGLHPFYSVVTRADGKQYRTETKWIRLLDTEAPFALAIAGSAPTLSWPATAGRRYEVLSSTNAVDAWQLRDSIVPTNATGRWSETNSTAPGRLYRLRTAP